MYAHMQFYYMFHLKKHYMVAYGVHNKYIGLKIDCKKFNCIILNICKIKKKIRLHQSHSQILMPIWNCIPYDVQMSNSFIGYTVATPSYRLTCHLMVHSVIHTHINKQIIWQDDLKHKTITCKHIQYYM